MNGHFVLYIAYWLLIAPIFHHFLSHPAVNFNFKIIVPCNAMRISYFHFIFVAHFLMSLVVFTIKNFPIFHFVVS